MGCFASLNFSGKHYKAPVLWKSLQLNRWKVRVASRTRDLVAMAGIQRVFSVVSERLVRASALSLNACRGRAATKPLFTAVSEAQRQKAFLLFVTLH